MKRLSDGIVRFFERQHFVIVSTVCRRTGRPHNSCKGIVKINRDGRIYLLDLYKWQTYGNLKKNPRMSITAVDEHRFKGWSLKGRGEIVPGSRLRPDVIRAWESRLSARLTHRVLKNMRQDKAKGHHRHPESQLPKPEYMIVLNVEEIVDLIPAHVK